MADALTLRTYRFDELSTTQLYDILQLRSDVFVVEQQSLFLDPDGLDDKALHMTAHLPGGTLVGCARLFAAGVKFPQASIGRFAVHRDYRKHGYGRIIFQYCIDETIRHFGAPIHIEAQSYLEIFYHSMGFKTDRGPVMVDGIPHHYMTRF